LDNRDRGQHFNANLVKEMCHLLGMEHNFTTAYHPQTYGQTKRFNKTLATMLSMYLNDNVDNWADMIPYVLFAYRTSLHESTLETPFYLTYGRDPVIPVDVALRYQELPPVDPSTYRATVTRRSFKAFELAKQNIERAQRRYQEYYRQEGVPREFTEGDQVWLFYPHNQSGKPRKFAHMWIGPFRVINKLSPINYVVRRNGGKRDIMTVHINRMKCFIDPALRPIEPPKEWPLDDTRPVTFENEDLRILPPTELSTTSIPPVSVPSDVSAPTAPSDPADTDYNYDEIANWTAQLLSTPQE